MEFDDTIWYIMVYNMVYIMVYIYIYMYGPSANRQETFVMEIGVPETLYIPPVYGHLNRYDNKYWVLKGCFRQTRMNLNSKYIIQYV